MFYGWDGRRYRNVTHRYPWHSRHEARSRRQDVLHELMSKNKREWNLHDTISAYYANMLNIGRGGEARSWLKSNLPRTEWRWLKHHDSELRRLIARPPGGVYATQRKLIVQELHRFR